MIKHLPHVGQIPKGRGTGKSGDYDKALVCAHKFFPEMSL